MESTGVPKGIQVTQELYDLLKDIVEWQPRWVVVKGKGEVQAYIHMKEDPPSSDPESLGLFLSYTQPFLPFIEVEGRWEEFLDGTRR